MPGILSLFCILSYLSLVHFRGRLPIYLNTFHILILCKNLFCLRILHRCQILILRHIFCLRFVPNPLLVTGDRRIDRSRHIPIHARWSLLLRTHHRRHIDAQHSIIKFQGQILSHTSKHPLSIMIEKAAKQRK